MKRAAILLAAFFLATFAQGWLDTQFRSAFGPALADDDALYLRSGERLRVASLGFDSLLADLYWIRTCLYFGGKLQQQRVTRSALQIEEMRLLIPLLRITTELDPHYTAAYRFGAFFLPLSAPDRAVEFVTSGIHNNPNDWRLYQDLAVIYWNQRRFVEAGDAYLRGSRVPGAPVWMQAMAATMIERGGDPATAGEIFDRLCQSADDQFIQQICADKLRRARPHR